MVAQRTTTFINDLSSPGAGGGGGGGDWGGGGGLGGGGQGQGGCSGVRVYSCLIGLQTNSFWHNVTKAQ